jgi:predicted transcriptional regulator
MTKASHQAFRERHRNPHARDFALLKKDEGGSAMEKKVLSAMKKAGKPVRPGDVAKMIGADSKEISKIISDLKKKGKVASPKRCFYEPV